MKNLIIANWKMNPVSLKEAEKLFKEIEKNTKGIKKSEIVVCPPFVFLSSFEPSSIKLGGQDCSAQEKGAFTGETSPLMLKDLGCQYVILGHSERRKYQQETDEIVNAKIKTALAFGLIPILCIDNMEQLKESLNGLPVQQVIIAFEPVWAIGTGKACSAEEAAKMRTEIQGFVGNVPVLYGGSVNAQNCRDYIDAGFQGLLVGGASLKPEEFAGIALNLEH
jgi:triosephosphate isomerase